MKMAHRLLIRGKELGRLARLAVAHAGDASAGDCVRAMEVELKGPRGVNS